MAIIKLDPMFISISGKIGGVILRPSKKKGYAIVSKAPARSKAKRSPAQLEHQQRFKEAVAYAKEALAQPELHAYYEEQAALLKLTAYSLAVSDYFKDRNLLKK